MSELKSEYTNHYSLTAGETDAEGRMPMTLIIARAIEVATEHANSLGIGYAALITHGIGWVLTRVSVEMIRYPRINESYSLTTWIEGINRLYSDRCFQITDADGQVIGHIRTMWIAIDMNNRTAADLTVLPIDKMPTGERICPITKPRKMPVLTPSRQSQYTFRYTDIDFNRHVNTIQYVRLVLNQWTMEHYDRHLIQHFDIAFHQECHYDDTVNILVEDSPTQPRVEITKTDGTRAVIAALHFSEL